LKGSGKVILLWVKSCAYSVSWVIASWFALMAQIKRRVPSSKIVSSKNIDYSGSWVEMFSHTVTFRSVCANDLCLLLRAYLHVLCLVAKHLSRSSQELGYNSSSNRECLNFIVYCLPCEAFKRNVLPLCWIVRMTSFNCLPSAVAGAFMCFLLPTFPWAFCKRSFGRDVLAPVNKRCANIPDCHWCLTTATRSDYPVEVNKWTPLRNLCFTGPRPAASALSRFVETQTQHAMLLYVTLL